MLWCKQSGYCPVQHPRKLCRELSPPLLVLEYTPVTLTEVMKCYSFTNTCIILLILSFWVFFSYHVTTSVLELHVCNSFFAGDYCKD